MANQVFNSELNNLREVFHKYGSFNDSNAKLDEIVKIISIYIYQIKTEDYEPYSLKSLSKDYSSEDYSLTLKTNELFKYISQQSLFLDLDGNSVFGTNPQLSLDNVSNEILFKLINTVVKIVDSTLSNNRYNFDMINEVFGHFIRDNFRGNIEDAQYMTPSEVVEFMVDIAIDEVHKINYTRTIKVCDPCCGVGSFLSVFHKRFEETNNSNKIIIVGQDKVQRMSRLTKINLALFDNNYNFISNGNSLIGDSKLNEHTGTVDIILTNPPFGANFSSNELKDEKLKYPLLESLFNGKNGNFPSEVLFVDRCLSLLNETGFMLAVLPDSVISSTGISSTLRQKLIKENGINIRGIVELPAVTFAQAGTRTKTSILFIQKGKTTQNNVFVGICKSLGFDVNIRKGVTNKYKSGTNELPLLFDGYKQVKGNISNKEYSILTDEPSSVSVAKDIFYKESWTPSHFNVNRFKAIEKLKINSDFDLVKLSSVANFESRIRNKHKDSTNAKCISVLHVYNEDLLALDEIFAYNPIYSGIECSTGDLLFSKINPRIPRMVIVPDLGIPLTCSTEFEIINGKNGISNELIKVMLGLPLVQLQIQNLTSGTSSSHNRIKSKDLANVMIPIPKDKSKDYIDIINKMNDNYEKISKLNIEKHTLKEMFFQMF